VITIVALLGLAWADNLAHGITYLLASAELHTATAVIAVGFVFLLNIAIQLLQSGLRALIVDSCSTQQQQTASAWAGRIISMANILSYVCSFINLPQVLPFLNASQFKILCILTSLALAITVSITCVSVHEKDPSLDLQISENHHSVISKLWYLCTSYRRLPEQVQRVFQVQFFSWIGWFPFLFYISA
jgi:solute carrier family 45 protein 1/2/4